LEEWVFAPAWSRDDRSLAEPRLAGAWIVLGGDDELRERVSRRLETSGAHVVGAAQAAEIGELLAEAGQPAGVVHLAGLARAMSPETIYEELVTAGVALGGASMSPVRMLHLSANAECVLDETVHHTAALAQGPVLVLPAEYPNLRMRSIDVDTRGPLDLQAIADIALIEAAIADPTLQVAWRGGRRWVKHFEPVRLPAGEERLPVKQQGVYLITGGLGGIGLTFARWLAARFKARLLLTSRSGDRSPAAEEVVREVEAAGGEVIVAAADAAAESAMRAALELAQRRWGRIDGVIHAAGNSGCGRLAALTSIAEARATFSPKVGGLEVLLKLLGEVPLDFVVLMSSINAVLGAPGTCDYAAANAVLDAFAEGGAHPRAWRQVLSVDWDAWGEVGMAVDLIVPQAQRQLRRAYLEKGIPSSVGIAALARGLVSRRPRLVVESHGMLDAIEMGLTTPTDDSRAPGAAQKPQEPQQAQQVVSRASSRPDLSSVFSVPSTDVEHRLAAIWSELLGVEPVGRQDDFFEMGGHSLLATRVLARVQQSFGVRLELRDVFDAPTVSRMAERIDHKSATALVVDEDREEIEF
jgi:NADP-dependent 3-hydroxy acid dehydrogenase YdfG